MISITLGCSASPRLLAAPIRRPYGSSASVNRKAAPRSRLTAAHVVAFRWGDSPPPSDTPSDTTSTANKPPAVLPTPTKRPNGLAPTEPCVDDASLEAEAAMRREEAVRNAQRMASEALDRARSWWAGVQDKRSLLLGGASLAVAAYLGGAVVGAVDRLPLAPQLFQAVGVGYSAWFWYRYVLFAAGRRELASRLADLRSGLAERVDELADRTLESHPNPGTGETGASATARGLVERLAARHARGAEGHMEGKGAAVRDDGSWLDEPEGQGEGEGAGAEDTDRYVNGLLQELDERTRNTSAAGGGGEGTGGGAGGRGPVVFAFATEVNGSEEGAGR
ncbi:hypothetical protein GPECTOR_8g2 [Gonium pectorale]|uniref:Cyanobacterial aminoacyl-tRNA synthetase CAAD domain-containing protein n=1 Tax=Gonium pectorale TaxID=33097 RepID=A0A150GSR2_GONPE|nr:hypothetical protein GPECTOR_8g2 [Gonium pectorale]|eukprot:KXZ52814.1 hypothetical protein GPECTOR_8g2 [Gonium pectorale]